LERARERGAPPISLARRQPTKEEGSKGKLSGIAPRRGARSASIPGTKTSIPTMEIAMGPSI
jgi:hypothetical protein